MYKMVIMTQCFIIVILFAECWLVFKNWRTALHGYLFMSCAAPLLSSIGYLMELLSQTGGEYFTALCLSYVGRAWTAFFLLLFIAEMIGLRIPTVIKTVLALFSTGTIIAVFTTRQTGLYYEKICFEKVGEFLVLHQTAGIWHRVYTAALALYMLAGLGLLLWAGFREKNIVAKKQMKLVFFACLVQGLVVLAQLLRVFSMSDVYDFFMLALPISAVFMLIAIFRYKLLDVESLARDYVMDELSEAIIAVDENGSVSYYNKPALQLFPELTTAPQKVTETLCKTMEMREPLTMQERIFSPRVNSLVQDGSVSGTLYALVDETEHFRYMDELKEQRRIADSANEAKSRFLSNMSHEIRTPINAVLGMNEMIMRTTAENKTMEYAANIRVSGKALLSIINDILDLSKIESGKMELTPVDYDMASLINDMGNMIRKRAEDKGLSLIVHVDPRLPARLHGDDIRIRQCVINLLTNAVKYTNEGSVTLTISCEKASGQSAEILYSVSDTGIGIKEEDMGKLFENFERIEEERNRSIEGTGLGMSITTQLLSMMGTSLDVKSEYGKGSVFSFKVTQKIVDNTQIGDFEKRLGEEIPEAGSHHELFTAPGARLLVVDDTDMNLVVIRGLLEETFCAVDTADSGAKALKILEENEYDALFIDHRMPKMDGLELLSRIKENKENPNSEKPCVALTANAISGIREMYLEAGFDDYLSKPVDPVKLENMLIGMLPEKKVHLYGTEENAKDREMYGEKTDRRESPANDEVLSALSDILGLNLKTALQNCGSIEVFKSAYVRFKNAIPEKTQKIRGFLELGDVENYTILVHSLKSSAALVGAMKLSEEAALLEKAGNEKDTEYIRNNTERVMALYGSYVKGTVESEEESAPVSDEDAMDEESFSEAMEAIAEFAEAFDMKSASDVLDSIEKEPLTKAMKEKVNSIRRLLRQADRDGLITLIRVKNRQDE